MRTRAAGIAFAFFGIAAIGLGSHLDIFDTPFASGAAHPDTPQEQALFIVEGRGADAFGDKRDWSLMRRFNALRSGAEPVDRERFMHELAERKRENDPLGHYVAHAVHFHGVLGKPDVDAARADLKRAAELGHAAAQLDLGFAYMKGHLGMDRDVELAERWMRRSADNGHAYAAETLSLRLAKGADGFAQDCQAAWDYAVQTQDAYDAQVDAWVHTPTLLGLIRIDDCQSLPARPQQAIRWLEEGAVIKGANYGASIARVVANRYESDPALKDAEKAAHWRRQAQTIAASRQ